MEREIVITADGSSSIRLTDYPECYHSINGAVTESMHIFINYGLIHMLKSQPGFINIYEAGFGTGLNCLLSVAEFLKHNDLTIYYCATELYPLTSNEVEKLNYRIGTEESESEILTRIHSAPWDVPVEIVPQFWLHKKLGDIKDPYLVKGFCKSFNLVYYDAFSPNIQPELWSSDIFSSLKECMKPYSTLVTYCCRGDLKRTLKECGFMVERLKGPPGKRHVTRATLSQI